jgi:CheY-like chemotaxis protein
VTADEAGKRRLVLVVEDNPDGAESLRILLGLCGYEVRVAYTGPDAVRLAGEWLPDVVLCDIGLPGLDGCGVAEALYKDPATAHVRLIAMSGYGDEETRRRALRSGFAILLTKPVDPDDLLRLLEQGRG